MPTRRLFPPWHTLNPCSMKKHHDLFAHESLMNCINASFFSLSFRGSLWSAHGTALHGTHTGAGRCNWSVIASLLPPVVDVCGEGRSCCERQRKRIKWIVVVSLVTPWMMCLVAFPVTLTTFLSRRKKWAWVSCNFLSYASRAMHTSRLIITISGTSTCAWGVATRDEDLQVLKKRQKRNKVSCYLKCWRLSIIKRK